MIQTVFPYKLQLHIFQLDEYSIGKFINWVFNHFFTRKILNKKPLVWTRKAKLLYYLSIFFAVIQIIFLTFLFGFVGLFFGLLLATQAYLFILFALLVLLPLESYQKAKIKMETKNKLHSLSHVKVIGITGSYGKTSVKEFLYQILRTKYYVLKTPESYNTPYGIAKVVNLELDNSYDYFICEMGAYKRGDIKEICDMVHPTYGILTGINEQHIETFGSLENTTLGKFELIDALTDDGFGVINIDNERIKNQSKKYTKKLISYGFSDKQFSISNIRHSSDETSFNLILAGKSYKANTKLFGQGILQNILAAATMAYQLDMKPAEIISAISMLKPVPHRLEIKHMPNMILIDDAYNSNVDGFQEAIHLLENFKETKIFVTPGIVDLGEKTLPIHEALGKLLGKIDYIFLVGDSIRTKGLEKGILNKKKIIYVNTLTEVWKKITDLNLIHPVVLLENDLPDNY